MDVELPNDGCNIINSSSSFYNYTNNNRTRSLYYIYDGKAIKASESTNTQGYTYTGTCLVTGDLIYKPEKQVEFQIWSFLIIILITVIIYKIMLERLLK